MRMSMQQKLVEQVEHKYHCRFCDKTFSTGRALGGHMRTHNELFRQPDEGPSSTGVEGNSSDDGHRLPDRHICELCREEFGSWKSWSKHCCVGAGGADGDDDDDSNGLSPPPPPVVLTEEEHLANCLILLSNARGGTDGAECSTAASVPIRTREAGECSTSDWKEIVDYVVVVVPPPSPQSEVPPELISTETHPTAHEIYECKTCQKVFNSHQALGGHRASHKKAMGYSANRPLESKPAKIARYTTMEDERNNKAGASSENMALAIVPFGETSSQLSLPTKKSKVHECTVCNRQFPSGQALGGHKRCHWSRSSSRGAAAAAAVAAEPLSVAAATELQVGNNNTKPQAFNSTVFSIDMPTPTDDFPITLWVDMPNAMYVEPERENGRENFLNVNIEEAESREVRSTDLSDLMDMNEREIGSKWLQIGFGSISDQEKGADQP